LQGRAGAEDVADEQERGRETEHELHRLAGAHLQPAAAVEGVQRKHHVDQERSNEQGRAERVAPEKEKIVAAGFHRVERDQAKRMVCQMGCHIAEQNEAAAQSQAAFRDTQALNRRSSGRRGGIDVLCR